MILDRGCRVLVLIAFAVCLVVMTGILAGCDRGAILEGVFAFIHHEPGMEDVILVLDGRIYSIPIEEGEPQPQLLYESAQWHVGQTCFVPLVRYEGDEMTLYTFRAHRTDRTGDIFAAPVRMSIFRRELPAGDLAHETSSARDGEPPEMMEEALTAGLPMTPIMFKEQHLTLQYGDAWYSLAVDAEGLPRRFRYTFHIDRLDVDHAEPGMAVAGHDRLVVDERVTVWHPDAWDEEDRHEIQRTIEEGLAHFDGVFRIEHRLPVNITIAEWEDQLPPLWHSGAPPHRFAVGQARAAYAGTPATRWVRAWLSYGLTTHALLQRGMLPWAVPTWVLGGLDGVLAFPPDGLVYYDYPRLIRSEGVTLHWFNPVSFEHRDVHEFLTMRDGYQAYHLGWYMVSYLVDEFGLERVVEYALTGRSHRGDDPDREDEVTREFFGMTQAEILRAALEEPLEVSERLLPDYVVSEWELLTDVSLCPSAPDIAPQGDRVAFMPREGILILVMDLESGEVQTVLGEDQHKFVTMGTLSWFPCGERLMFNARREGAERNLYAFTVGDPGTIQEVVVSDSTDSGGVVSPCGELVAFRSERTGISQLFIKNLLTGEVTRLTDGAYPKYWPRWSPGGDRLAFESRCPGEDNVSLLGVIDLESGDIQYHDLHPWYRTWEMSRPEWLGDDEILVPVLADEVRTTISVNLLTGEERMWGGMVQSLQRVIPIPGSDDEYLVRIFDMPRPAEAEEFAGQIIYRRLMRATFEEYRPR